MSWANRKRNLYRRGYAAGWKAALAEVDRILRADRLILVAHLKEEVPDGQADSTTEEA